VLLLLVVGMVCMKDSISKNVMMGIQLMEMVVILVVGLRIILNVRIILLVDHFVSLVLLIPQILQIRQTPRKFVEMVFEKLIIMKYVMMGI
jgi:hypothetical protein